MEACDLSHVYYACVLVLVRVVCTELDTKTLKIILSCEISDWTGFKSLIDPAFCAKRTPGYLQVLEFCSLFVVTTDASNIAFGATIFQGTIALNLPISYISCTLSNADKNNTTTEKRIRAFVWVVKQFCPYIFGHKLTVVMNHRPLT